MLSATKGVQFQISPETSGGFEREMVADFNENGWRVCGDTSR
jgi:hypothetical protein